MTDFCEFRRTPLDNGMYYTVCLDPKYKVNRLAVYFVMPFSEKTAAANALLTCLLTKTCRSFPTRSAYADRLNRLYGAELEGDVQKVGGAQVLCFSVEGMADDYALTDEKLTEEMVAMLCDSILEPCLSADGLFPEDSFLLERQDLLDSVLAEQNNKRTYAFRQFSKVMFAGESGGVSKLGTPESVASLTREQVTGAWHTMLAHGRIEFVFTGCSHEEAARTVCDRRFSGLHREKIFRCQTKLHQKSPAIRRVTEEMQIAQAKLFIGYHLGNIKSQRAVLRVMNCVLGASPNSRFFQNVREKKSLCYYCATRMFADQGCYIVDSGINAADAKITEEAIQNEIDDVAKNGCTKEELTAAKKYLSSAFLSSPDSVASMDWWNFLRIMHGTGSLNKERRDTENVTAEQVSAMAARLQKDTVYLLREENAHDKA